MSYSLYHGWRTNWLTAGVEGFNSWFSLSAWTKWRETIVHHVSCRLCPFSCSSATFPQTVHSALNLFLLICIHSPIRSCERRGRQFLMCGICECTFINDFPRRQDESIHYVSTVLPELPCPCRILTFYQRGTMAHLLPVRWEQQMRREWQQNVNILIKISLCN